MKPGDYDAEHRVWLIFGAAFNRGRALADPGTPQEQSRALLAASSGHDFVPKDTDMTWYTGAVRAVGLTDNEGAYKRSGLYWVKELDLGHRAWDEIESARNTDRKLSYKGCWARMRVLPVESTRAHLRGATTALVGANGCLLSPGTYMFVICEDGAVRYFPNDDSQCEPAEDGKHYVQYLPHAALAYHRPVLAAGNLGVVGGGTLAWAASNSGHYRVDDRMCEHNLLTALSAHGYDYHVTHDPDSVGLDLDTQRQHFCFYKFPTWRRFQTGKKQGMTVLRDARPDSNVVTEAIHVTLDALDEFKRRPGPESFELVDL